MRKVVLVSFMFSLLFAGKPAFSESQPAAVAVQHPLVLAASDSQTGRGAGLQSSTPLTSTPAVSPSVYLPTIFGQPGVISGYVYSGNVPLEGYPVHLMRMFPGQPNPQPNEIMSTTTKADGRYDFFGAPPTNFISLYRVEIYPSQRGGSTLVVASQLFDHTDWGEKIVLNPLDHATVLRLDVPSSGAEIQLPYTFRWTSNLSNVGYMLFASTVPCCIGIDAGTSTSVVFPYSPDGQWPALEYARSVFVVGSSSTIYVKSLLTKVTFKMP